MVMHNFKKYVDIKNIYGVVSQNNLEFKIIFEYIIRIFLADTFISLYPHAFDCL